MVPARSDTSLHRLLAVLGVILAGSEANAQAVSAGQQLQKASWISDLQGGLSNGTNLTGVLPTARVNVQQGQNGSACNCFAPGLKDECAQIEATWSIQQAVYVDQPKHPIYICICQGAPFTAQDLASKYSQVSHAAVVPDVCPQVDDHNKFCLAVLTRHKSCDIQVPAFLRQWVTSISAIPAAARSAYTAAGHITFFANTASDWADVMVHESAHAQDQNISGSQPYLTALGQDSCVPDDYAGTNNVECYAQDMVVFLYKLWRPYAPPLGIECMTNQLQILDNSQAPLLQAYINKTGDT
ncbi:hypothetical protein MMC14_010472 [Varicellaria rhodocarpa]|nr:hypothetical protein [Varicellaria rhodocarpa]